MLHLFLQRLEQLRRRVLAVSLGVVADPSPQVLTCILHLQLRLPVQLLVGQAGVGRQVEHITLPPVNNLVVEVSAHDRAERLDHLENGGSPSGAQVPGLHTGLVRPQVVERDKVALGKVAYVDVIADGGAVAGGVVVTKDQELLALAGGHLSHQGEQVVWDTLRVLAHDAGGVRAAGVEVAQVGAVPLLVRLACLLELVALSRDVILDNALDHRLCAAVCVGRANRAVLWDGNHVGEASGIAVDGGGRGEDDVGDIVIGHGAHQGDATADIDAVVLEGDLAGLANGLRNSVSFAQSWPPDLDNNSCATYL